MQEYQTRRQKLMKQMAGDSVAILFSAPLILRNGDAHFRFRQDSDFYYLTGFNEPEAVAVFIPNRKEGEFILFCRTRDPAHEIWDGLRAGQEGAVKTFGANQAFPIADIDKILPEILLGCQSIYTTLGKNSENDNRTMQWVNAIRKKIRSGINAPTKFIAVEELIAEMRLIKSPHEIDLMRKAGEISVNAHKRAMRACKPGMKEFQLDAELQHEFYKNGALACAYTTIVGGGKNACILHYIENADALNNNELVLIDAGCEYENYASDITCTFPVNGRFTAEQKEIYNIVLNAQLEAKKQIRAGNPYIKMQETVIRVITEGLVSCGILSGNVNDLIEKRAYFDFYMHNAGHWLGLDVHDAGSYRINNDWRKFQAGMTCTIEPGIYISANNPKVDKKWWNIGVRIEDDILVTDNGHEVLTPGLPRTISEIEEWMKA